MRTEFYYDDNEQGDGGIAGIKVVLSRRDIEGLLAKLNGETQPLLQGPTSCFPTIVTVEENEEHAAHPRAEHPPPARLHPDMESYSR